MSIWVLITAALYGAAATLAALALTDPAPAQRRAILKRLSEGNALLDEPRGLRERIARLVPVVQEVLQRLGERRSAKQDGAPTLDELLLQAGYRHPQRMAIYRGSRIAAALAVAVLVLALLLLLGGTLGKSLPLALYASVLGLLVPRWYLIRRRRARQKELQTALPDMLDLMVVCTDSGLGLTQALLKVAEEIGPVSSAMQEELNRTNAEMRAGVGREDALKNLGERNGVGDLRTLVNVLIQSSRFGTPVAQTLRQQSAALRRRQQQRMEEEAGKMQVRLLFPMVLFIFPPLVIVVLGPAVLQMVQSLAALK